jgi:hypothetical protein
MRCCRLLIGRGNGTDFDQIEHAAPNWRAADGPELSGPTWPDSRSANKKAAALTAALLYTT